VAAQEFEQVVWRDQRDVSAQDNEIAGEISKRLSGATNRVPGPELAFLKGPGNIVPTAGPPHRVRTVSHDDGYALWVQSSCDAQRIEEQGFSG
jgi:hypothetical protein